MASIFGVLLWVAHKIGGLSEQCLSNEGCLIFRSNFRPDSIVSNEDGIGWLASQKQEQGPTLSVFCLW
jgi:hypothetical protein